MSGREHASSLMLPIMATIIVPLLLMYLESNMYPSWVAPANLMIFMLITGIGLIIPGILLLYGTIRLFSKVGQGTLAPWHPTKKLVVTGIYRHVRNPMITGVLLIILGESLVFGTLFVFGWFLFFFIGNHVYFIKSEEPGLVKRFGEEYLQYEENVPRWIPQRIPWFSSTEDIADEN